MAETVAFKYRAFISYSHADTGWVKWLHRALEGFRIDKDLVGRETSTGPIPKSLRPIFRDRDDFTAGHTLTDQTLAALDASHALIAICSPSAAKSEYVTEEIRLFKSRHPDRPVIPLIVDGKPGDLELECFPPALRFKLDTRARVTKKPVEVLAADAREEGDGKNLALAKVVAGLLGVSSDDIYRRAERDRRRKGRVRNGVIAVLAFLAIAATGSTVYAWQQLKTNEAFLDATLERFTSLVDRSVSLANEYSVPAKVTLGILEEAEGMLGVMAAYGRDTPKMKYRRAVMLRAFADNYRVLGNTSAWQTRIDEALRLMTELVNYDPANIGWLWEKSLSHERKGDLLLEKGDHAGALREHQTSRDILSSFAKEYADNAEWQRSFAVTNLKIGDVHKARGDFTAALKAYEDFLGVAKALAESDPDNAGLQRDIAISYGRIGSVHETQGDLAEALKAYEDSLDISKALAESDPDNRQWQSDLCISHNRVGFVLLLQNEYSAALKAHEDSLGVAKALAENDPDNAVWQLNLCDTYEKIGAALGAQGDFTAALRAFRDCLAIRERLAAADPDNPGRQRDLALSYGSIATALKFSGKIEQARNRYLEARDIVAKLVQQSPNDFVLARALAEMNEQIAALAKAQEIKPATDQPEQAAR